MERFGKVILDDFNDEKSIVVIMPVYNCKKYLENAVNSVLQQSYQKINLVIVDDGSTDGSTELCDELAKANDRIDLLHQENSGVSAARNRGIEYVFRRNRDNLEKCYIAFLDADDEWKKDFFHVNLFVDSQMRT